MVAETKNSNLTCPPTWRVKYRSDFTTFSPVLLQEQSPVDLLLERVLVSWSSAIDERSEHENLHDSDRRSVIPYVHGRMVLYCPSLALPV
jgi:hypothetical protein